MCQHTAARVALWSRLAAFAATLTIGPAAFAGPIALDTWHQLSVSQSGSLAAGFEVFDFGQSLRLISTPGSGGSCGDDPVPCLITPGISHAKFRLTTVSHFITILGTTAAAPGGGAGYRMAASAPEPATWLFLGLGIALIALGWTRSRPGHRH